MDRLFHALDRFHRVRRSLIHRWRLGRIERERDAVRTGWVVFGTLEEPEPHIFDLAPPVSMRVRDVALAMNETRADIWNEMYRRGSRYDVVVFFKGMSHVYQEEAKQLKSAGTKVIFDANVNYYEDWGNFRVPATRPTPEQMRDVVAMTQLADHVVADSTYLEKLAARLNPAVTWIPDNVDTDFYHGERCHRPMDPVRLVWCGVAKKAEHLRMLAGAIPRSPCFELTLVSDHLPEVMHALATRLPCRYRPFSEARYRHELRRADIILSPKYLDCSYEMGHTEYKISPGMALGLPVIASPQASYVEALAGGGGLVVDGEEEWRQALEQLGRDSATRERMGSDGRATVRSRYATAVVADRYHRLILELAGRRATSTSLPGSGP